MTYFNDNDNFYSGSASPEKFNSYPFLRCETSAITEEVHGNDTPTFTDCWSTVNQPGPPLNNHLATRYGEWSFGLFADLCLTHESGLEPLFPIFDPYCLINWHRSYWSTASHSTHPEYPNMLSRIEILQCKLQPSTSVSIIWDFENLKLGYSLTANSSNWFLGFLTVQGTNRNTLHVGDWHTLSPQFLTIHHRTTSLIIISPDVV